MRNAILGNNLKAQKNDYKKKTPQKKPLLHVQLKQNLEAKFELKMSSV